MNDPGHAEQPGIRDGSGSALGPDLASVIAAAQEAVEVEPAPPRPGVSLIDVAVGAGSLAARAIISALKDKGRKGNKGHRG